jgi:hypothetical protein
MSGDSSSSPSLASREATARPMPREAPVTMAILLGARARGRSPSKAGSILSETPRAEPTLGGSPCLDPRLPASSPPEARGAAMTTGKEAGHMTIGSYRLMDT